MRKVNYNTGYESWDDMYEAQRYNRSLELTFKDKTGTHTHKISAGNSDSLDVYQEGSETFLLSRNYGLHYIGLEVFEGDALIGDVFFESGAVDELKIKLSAAPYNLIKRLLGHINF